MTPEQSDKNRVTAIILAAGKGTRMNSALPKVLHPVAGKPMIIRVIEAVKGAGATDIRVVVGYGEKLVRQVVASHEVNCFTQKEQLGTADAVKTADIDSIEGTVLIINGDHPLLEADDVKEVFDDFTNGSQDLTVVTSKLKNPKSFGRIVRQNDSLKAIVEAKDASAHTLEIKEVNTGIYVMTADVLKNYLPKIKNDNAQSEYYFTDMVSLSIEDGKTVSGYVAPKKFSFGVNSQRELAQATKLVFKRTAGRHLDNGVVIIDDEAVYIEDHVKIGASTVLYPNTFLNGVTSIGSFCVIEPGSFLVNAQIGDSTIVKANSHLEDCQVANRVTLGPFARLRPGANLADEVKIGNFVEIKKASLAKGAKASHLTYIGDAEIGENVNIGCGTITCNYAADKKKYKTVIGDNTFVGSDVQFVAPITVGKNAVIGSGSTITKNVPDNALAVARGRQFIKENYKGK